jgi:hypothetical protein
MIKIGRNFVLLACASLMIGCASGPKFREVSASIPALNSEQGRIYLYRTTTIGAALQPTVRVNNDPVGDSKAKGFFYIDRPPGNYKVETSTEVKRSLSLTLDKGETRYVRFDISMGFFVGHVYPNLVENAVGEKEIEACSYTGPALSAVSGP